MGFRGFKCAYRARAVLVHLAYSERGDRGIAEFFRSAEYHRLRLERSFMGGRSCSGVYHGADVFAFGGVQDCH